MGIAGVAVQLLILEATGAQARTRLGTGILPHLTPAAPTRPDARRHIVF
jgi:hypothetical protein